MDTTNNLNTKTQDKTDQQIFLNNKINNNNNNNNNSFKLAPPNARQQQKDALQQRKPSISSLKLSSLPWRLMCKDFTSKEIKNNSIHKKDSFLKLIDDANIWLKNTPEVTVASCETITWQSHDPSLLGDTDNMLLTRSVDEKSYNYYNRGLRLWLIPNFNKKKINLILFDFFPNEKENLEHLIIKVNKKINKKFFKGKIITCETVSIPLMRSGVSSLVTRWTEGTEEDNASLFIIRLFVAKETNEPVTGSPSNYRNQRLNIQNDIQLNYKDFIPKKYDNESYENYESLVARGNEWLKNKQIKKIVSLQSLIVQKHQGGKHESIGTNLKNILPGIHNSCVAEYFRILRIFYLEKKDDGMEKEKEKDGKMERKRGGEGGMEVSQLNNETKQQNKTLLFFVFETFSPEMVVIKDASSSSVPSNQIFKKQNGELMRVERIKEIFSKVNSFLKNTNMEILQVETVHNPAQVYLEEELLHSIYSLHQIKFLFTIRLYLITQGINNDNLFSIMNSKQTRKASIQPPANQLTDLESGDQKLTNESRPLFLRHVVGRQYKYRWFVLALSAFSCMTIIVVVSVVYSNR